MDFILNKGQMREKDWSDILPNSEAAATMNDAEHRGNTLVSKNMNIFITEDLSPFRLKLLHYIKDCNKELEMFDRITTRNGNITCRKKGTSEWFTITSPDDFLQAGIPMKRSEFEKELLF